MKRPVIRVGDKVRVLRDRFIERIGYPLVWRMLMDEVENDPRTRAAYELLTGKSTAGVLGLKPRPLPRDFLAVVAKLRVEERCFGGRQRSIHYEKPGGYGRRAGSVLEVYGKRLAKTGIYCAPSYGVSSYDGEPWEEPGGLDECKTHIILTTSAGDIEACDVELLS